VVELFTSEENGVGTIPAELHDKLVEKGLWGLTKGIFLWGGRLVEVFKGIWDGISEGVQVLAVVFGFLFRAVNLVMGAFGQLLVWLGLADTSLGGLNNTTETSVHVAHMLGEVIGALVAGFAAYQAVVIGVRAVTLAWQGAQWLLNIALTA